jgi:hypothetical protein
LVYLISVFPKLFPEKTSSINTLVGKKYIGWGKRGGLFHSKINVENHVSDFAKCSEKPNLLLINQHSLDLHKPMLSSS